MVEVASSKATPVVQGNETDSDVDEDDAEARVTVVQVEGEMRKSAFEECIPLSLEERLSKIKEILGMENDYYKGEEDYQQLQMLPDIERETELMNREARVLMESDKIDLII